MHEEQIRARAREMVSKSGVTRAAAKLGITTDTLARLITGDPIRRATWSLLRESLAAEKTPYTMDAVPEDQRRAITDAAFMAGMTPEAYLDSMAGRRR